MKVAKIILWMLPCIPVIVLLSTVGPGPFAILIGALLVLLVLGSIASLIYPLLPSQVISTSPNPKDKENDKSSWIIWVVIGFFLMKGIKLVVTALSAIAIMRVVQLVVLRAVLKRNDRLPFRFVPFLKYATKHGLLRKVGDGYIFTHPLLREGFASQDRLTMAA